MFGTIRHHQAWLWVIIAGCTIVSFIVYFNPASKGIRGGRAGGEQEHGMINGVAITGLELENAQRDILLNYLLRTGKWLEREDPVALQREEYHRVFAQRKAKEMGIEASTEAAAAVAARIVPRSMTFSDFVDKALKPHGLTAADFDRLVRWVVVEEQLRATVGTIGNLVTDQEAELFYTAEHIQLTAQLAYFAASNYLGGMAGTNTVYLGGITVTPEDLAKFYQDHKPDYRVPDQVEVDYVRFAATNFTNAALGLLTNLDQVVDRLYMQLGTNAYPEAKTAEEAKALLKADVIRENAVDQAHHAADELAMALYTNAQAQAPQPKPPAEELARLAAQLHDETPQTCGPFDEFGPTNLKVTPDFASKAFHLTPTEPFSPAIVDKDGVYVLALRRQVPHMFPELHDIEARVTADYRQSKAMDLAREAATKFYVAVTNGLAQSNTFAAVAAATHVGVEALPPITQDMTNLPQIEGRIDLRMLKNVAFTTAVGGVSPVAPAPDGAFVVAVDKQMPGDDSKKAAELPRFLATLRAMRQNEAYELWLLREENKDGQFAQIIHQFDEEMQKRAAGGRAGQ